MNSIADALYRAADVVELHGLWKSGGSGGGTCAVVALIDATDGDHALVNRAERVLLAHLGLVVETLPCHAVYAWNDAPERPEAEVVAALRGAAAVAEAAAVLEAAKESAPVEVSA